MGCQGQESNPKLLYTMDLRQRTATNDQNRQSPPSNDTGTVNPREYSSFSRKSWITLSTALGVFVLVSLTLCFSSKFVDQLYWIIYKRPWVPDLELSKGPLVQLVGDNLVLLAWESQASPQVNITCFGELRQLEGIAMTIDYKQGRMAYIYREYYSIDQEQTRLEFKIQNGAKNPYTFNIPMPFHKKSIKMVVMGDNQMGDVTFQNLLGCIQQEQVDVFLHLGDMVQMPLKDADWQVQFFNPLKSSNTLATLPFLITQGNHDLVYGRAAEYFPETHELPQSPFGIYYALTLAGARFIIMDSNHENDEQIIWLEQELNSELTQIANFIIVIVHVPPFIEYWDPKKWKDNDEWKWPVYVREKAVPLFEKYKVDLVLSGHQHNFQRGQRNGVTYVISGGGGGTLDREKVEGYGFYSTTILSHHYLILEVNIERIILTAKLQSGQVVDTVQLEKRE